MRQRYEYDMHRNVWEWCGDRWHGNYKGAPTDGSAWIDESQSESDSYILRGGSWFISPWYCRSASRVNFDAGFCDYDYGFRVVYSVPRT